MSILSLAIIELLTLIKLGLLDKCKESSKFFRDDLFDEIKF